MASSKNPSAVLVSVAVWSVGLGVLMEAVLVGLAAWNGKPPVLKPILADLVQKVSWSTFVCAGLGLGTFVSKNRATSMGILGVLSAPLAFYLSKIIHKSLAQALSVAVPSTVGPSAWTLAGIRALEYAVLGAWIGWISRKESVGFSQFVLAGALVGILFTSWNRYLFLAVPEATWIKILPRAINEFLFPVGCSVILYAANRKAG